MVSQKSLVGTPSSLEKILTKSMPVLHDFNFFQVVRHDFISFKWLLDR